MRLRLPDGPLNAEINLPISKSIANRYLIISALASPRVTLNLFQGLKTKMLKQVQHDHSENLPEDVKILFESLQSNSSEINIGMAGTAMRFVTAYYAIQEGKSVTLTGADRMKKRPISDLVDALLLLGAHIEYVEEEGFPPIKILGKSLGGGEVTISASVSSQFISALMMIGPMMEKGLQINLSGKTLSRPYIELTANCMRQCGVVVEFDGNTIRISGGSFDAPNWKVESDWSSASYFYALAAARPNSTFLLKGLNLNSPQGDAVLTEWFAEIGVTSTQKENGVEIQSQDKAKLPAEIDFTDHPDLAQTFAFLAAALGQPLKLTGLDNLRLKETDRVEAIRTELQKVGVSVSVDGNEMKISGKISVEEANIKTYNDHRMAMSAAVLASQIPIEIENPEVVVKSFPDFWSAFNF